MMALPFFVLAGEIMNRGGLTKRIIAFCDVFLGRIRGRTGLCHHLRLPDVRRSGWLRCGGCARPGRI